MYIPFHTVNRASYWQEIGQILIYCDQGDEVYLRKAIADEAVLPLSLTRHGEDTPRVSSTSSDKSYKAGASDSGW